MRLAHRPGKRIVSFGVLILNDPNAVFVLENAVLGACLTLRGN